MLQNTCLSVQKYRIKQIYNLKPGYAAHIPVYAYSVFLHLRVNNDLARTAHFGVGKGAWKFGEGNNLMNHT